MTKDLNSGLPRNKSSKWQGGGLELIYFIYLFNISLYTVKNCTEPLGHAASTILGAAIGKGFEFKETNKGTYDF